MDWATALELPEEIRRFVDSSMAGELSLPLLGELQVPQYLGMPSLLLFRVGDSPHSHAQELKQCITEARGPARSLIIAGVSGCGKTRSLYDLFCGMDGLYFVVTTELNGGSKDLEHLINLLNSYLHRRHNPPSIQCHPELARNRMLLTVLVTLLLTCRMKLYNYCKSRPGYSSRKWLLLQAACRGFAGEDKKPLERDPFHELFKSAAEKLRPDNVEDELEPLRNLLCSMGTIPTIAVDEAQVAMKQLADGYFWSASRKDYVPLATPLEQALRVDISSGHLIFLAGTGYTLHFKEELIGTGTAKLTRTPRFTRFGSFTSAISMLAYAKQAVRVSEEDEKELKALHTMFTGRFRPFAAVLEFMIAKQLGMQAAALCVFDGLTTSTGVAEMKLSFYQMVARLAKEPAIRRGVKLMQVLETATVNYFCGGKGFTFMGDQEACITLAEAGVGRLVETGHKFAVVLEEYLALVAAKNFFEDRHEEKGHRRSSYLVSRWLELSSRVPLASGQGLRLQNLYALAFQSMWQQHGGVMSQMPLIKPLLELETCPVGLKHLASRPGTLPKGMMSVCVASEVYDYHHYLLDLENNKQCCTTLVSGGNEAAPDSVFGIVYVNSEGEEEILHVLEQDKFPKNPLTGEQMLDGLVKTGFPEDSPEYKLLSDVQLRLLVMAPESKPEKHPRYCWEVHGLGKSVGFIVIDAENVAELLGGDDAAATFVAIMKGAATNPGLKKRKAAPSVMGTSC